MYILDTDILSNLLKKSPSPALIRRLADVPVEQQFTSAITLGELAYGAHRLPHGEALLRKILEQIHPSQILSFDYEACLVYGKTRAVLEKGGITVPEADLRIGSIALAKKMTVITANLRHFKLIPQLTVENWI